MSRWHRFLGHPLGTFDVFLTNRMNKSAVETQFFLLPEASRMYGILINNIHPWHSGSPYLDLTFQWFESYLERGLWDPLSVRQVFAVHVHELLWLEGHCLCSAAATWSTPSQGSRARLWPTGSTQLSQAISRLPTSVGSTWPSIEKGWKDWKGQRRQAEDRGEGDSKLPPKKEQLMMVIHCIPSDLSQHAGAPYFQSRRLREHTQPLGLFDSGYSTYYSSHAIMVKNGWIVRIILKNH